MMQQCRPNSFRESDTMPNCRKERRRSSGADTLRSDTLHANSDRSAYVRARDLPRLVPVWPNEIETLNRSDHARLLARLRRALRVERRRGLSGHWAYDLARHAQLLRAYRAETAVYLKEGDVGREPVLGSSLSS